LAFEVVKKICGGIGGWGDERRRDLDGRFGNREPYALNTVSKARTAC
jgi:hypothetical protein